MRQTASGDINNFSARHFSEPDVRHYPVLSWVWNAPVTREKIRAQIAEMLAGGFRSFYIIPEPPEFRPSSMVTELSPDYLSAEYFDAVRYAVAQARSKGMRVWLYDEGGWPSGSACGRVTALKPEAALKRLVKTDAGFERRTVNPQRADITEECAVKTFAQITHRQYFDSLREYLGDTVPLLFTDEPVCAMPALPYGFEDDFSRRYGYDLRDHFDALTSGASDEAGRRARMDYFELLGETLRERFFKYCRELCHENGVGFTGHLDRDHLTMNAVELGYGSALDTLRMFDIPGVDVICEQIVPPVGREPCGEGNCFFPRFASSAAAQSGTGAALSESFAVYGSGLTPDEMRYILNYQAARGINLFNYMIDSLGREGFLAYSERPSYSPEQPGYNALRAVNDYTARLSYVNSLGRALCPTALYVPDRDLQCGGDTAKSAAASFESLGRMLDESNVSFDLLTDASVREAEVDGGRLMLGRAEYSAVVVPDCRYMPRDVANKLAGLSGAPVKLPVDTPFRFRMRETSDGSRIIFAYNEGGCKLTAPVRFDSGKRYIYRLKLTDGSICEASAGDEFTLECGEEVVLLYTDSRIICGNSEYARGESAEIYSVEAAPVMRFRLNESGMVREDAAPEFTPSGFEPWVEIFGADFSGEVMYTVKFDAGHSCKFAAVTLEGLEYSARVTLNGEFCGDAVFKPYTVRCCNVREGENSLEIRVANTAANQFVFSDAEKVWTAAQLGTYHERAKGYERKNCGGGLKNIKVVLSD